MPADPHNDETHSTYTRLASIPAWDAVIVGVAEPLAVDDKVPELLVDTLADGLSDTELEMDLVTLGEGDGDGAPLLVAEAEGD